MKVLFAVSNESMSDMIVKKYQNEYKQIISSKNAFYFNSIIKELQKDKTYDCIVIAEDLEDNSNVDYDMQDQVLLEKLDKISDEATFNGRDIPIIIICSDRRSFSDETLNKMFGMAIYNAVLGNDRNISYVCKLLKNPRTKKEAKEYYKLSETNGYEPNAVSETELSNIREHFMKLPADEAVVIDSFNKIVEQYNDKQLKSICSFLPDETKKVLGEKSEKYKKIMAFAINNEIRVEPNQNKKGTLSVFLNSSNKQTVTRPIVIPTMVNPLKNIETKKEESFDDLISKSYNNQKQLQENSKKENPEQENLKEEISGGNDMINPFAKKEKKESEQNNQNAQYTNPFAQQVQNPFANNPAPQEPQQPQQPVQMENPFANSQPVQESNPFAQPQQPVQMENPFAQPQQESNPFANPMQQPQQPVQMENPFAQPQQESNPFANPMQQSQQPVQMENPFAQPQQESNPFANPMQQPQQPAQMENPFANPMMGDNMNPFASNMFASEPPISEVATPEPVESKNYVMSKNIASSLPQDKRIAIFVGSTKNGTSFIVNNLAELFSTAGIKTAILDTTKNRNSYYIYTNNDDKLRSIAVDSIAKLSHGQVSGIDINKNLTVFTSLPEDRDSLNQVDDIVETLANNYQLVLIDADFDTNVGYFAQAQDIYLVQSMDILTIQPLTAFLKELKEQGFLDETKIKIILNKAVKLKQINEKTIIGGMSCYNNPSMSYMAELFDKDLVKYISIPFETDIYIKYLESVVFCNVSLKGYSKQFINTLKELANMVYPLANAKMNFANMFNTAEDVTAQNVDVLSNRGNINNPFATFQPQQQQVQQPQMGQQMPQQPMGGQPMGGQPQMDNNPFAQNPFAPNTNMNPNMNSNTNFNNGGQMGGSESSPFENSSSIYGSFGQNQFGGYMQGQNNYGNPYEQYQENGYNNGVTNLSGYENTGKQSGGLFGFGKKKLF